jgi:putative glutamine amidotransferase
LNYLDNADYRPLIGISTARYAHPEYGIKYHIAYRANAIAIEQAGGLPIMIPCELETNTLRALYERLDGILLPGGGDVDPSAYHAEKHPKTDHTDPARDQAEITLARWAAEDQTPLFAICRGQQVVNVALGGTLLQDVDSLWQTSLKHNNRGGIPRDLLAHEVEVKPDTLLAKVMGVPSISVNSIHHQAIAGLASSLSATAYSPDGLIEAVELPDHPHFLGVQWHPEDLQAIPEMRNLFAGLVAAAKSYATSRHIHLQ